MQLTSVLVGTFATLASASAISSFKTVSVTQFMADASVSCTTTNGNGVENNVLLDLAINHYSNGIPPKYKQSIIVPGGEGQPMVYVCNYNQDVTVNGFTHDVAHGIHDQISSVCGSSNANGFWHDDASNFTLGFDLTGCSYCPDLQASNQ